MALKLIFSYIFFSLSINILLSQNFIKGKIIDENTNDIENTYIENLTQKTISVSNKEGNFSIEAKLNDTIQFRNISFHRKKLIITDKVIKNKNLLVIMETIRYKINEIVLGLNLTGDLEIDTKSIAIEEKREPIKLKYAKTTKELGYPKPSKPTILEPIDFIYSIFGSKAIQTEKLKSIKEQQRKYKELDEKYQKSVLKLMFNLSDKELEEFIKFCDINKFAILKYNKLKILELFSICYDVFKEKKK